MAYERTLPLSEIIQVALLVSALLIGRYWLTSHKSIVAVCIAAAVLALMVDILAGGEGACMVLAYTPIIYILTTVLRKDL